MYLRFGVPLPWICRPRSRIRSSQYNQPLAAARSVWPRRPPMLHSVVPIADVQDQRRKQHVVEQQRRGRSIRRLLINTFLIQNDIHRKRIKNRKVIAGWKFLLLWNENSVREKIESRGGVGSVFISLIDDCRNTISFVLLFLGPFLFSVSTTPTNFYNQHTHAHTHTYRIWI